MATFIRTVRKYFRWRNIVRLTGGRGRDTIYRVAVRYARMIFITRRGQVKSISCNLIGIPWNPVADKNQTRRLGYFDLHFVALHSFILKCRSSPNEGLLIFFYQISVGLNGKQLFAQKIWNLVNTT